MCQDPDVDRWRERNRTKKDAQEPAPSSEYSGHDEKGCNTASANVERSQVISMFSGAPPGVLLWGRINYGHGALISR